MASFLSPLVVSPESDGRKWKVMRSFTFRIGKKYSRKWVSVPRGFKTDFASIPRFLWWLPYWAKFNKAPVLHDWLYHDKKVQGKPIQRKKADQIFLEAMMVEWRGHKHRLAIARLEYFAVRLFGWLFWHKEKISGGKNR